MLILVALGIGLGFLVHYAPAYFIHTEPPDNTPRLEVGGTSSAGFMLDIWQGVYQKQKGVKVAFESSGSTQGVNDMIGGKYVIGFTHAPMSADQKQKALDKGGEVVQVPVVLCAVVPVYNLKELKDKPPLQFTGALLADIFSGKITKWDDPAIAKHNKDVRLPKDKPIVVVHRADSSGTTSIFSEYLYNASEDWRNTMGKPGSKVNWKVGVGEQRNNGVAAYVFYNEGAIGYVDLMHVAPYKGLQYGAVQNKDGTAFIHAKPANQSAAGKAAVSGLGDDLTKIELINRPGSDSYPICGAVWAVCYQTQPEDRRKMVSEFLNWVTHDGQKFAAERAHAPLPPEVIERVEKKVNSIAGK